MKATDQAILLNRISYGESSLIVTFYTRTNGIQKFIFQGGKKKAHSLFPLAISEITYYKRPDSELGKLTAVEHSKMLNDLPFHPVKSTIAFFIVELLQKCLKTEEGEEYIFSFLEEEIIRLDQSDEFSFFPLRFLLNLAQHIGIYPHKTDDNAPYFNLMEGTFSAVKPITGDIYSEGAGVELIVQLMDEKLHIEDLLNTKKNRSEALEILIRYFQLHIPQFKDMNSLEIIREVLND